MARRSIDKFLGFVLLHKPPLPIGVCVDKHDCVWVISLNNRVQLFTPEGKYLLGITASGKKPGELIRPYGVAHDSKGYFYVADAGNQRIQKFAIPEP